MLGCVCVLFAPEPPQFGLDPSVYTAVQILQSIKRDVAALKASPSSGSSEGSRGNSFYGSVRNCHGDPEYAKKKRGSRGPRFY